MPINKKLVLVNTGVSYLRTILNIAITLFATRWVVRELGVEDFGLFGVVGGVVVFAAFINTAMSAGARRFFANALGRSEGEVKLWFSTSVYIHLVSVGLVLLLSIPIFLIAFNYLLKIPDTRMSACVVVYWCSVLTTCFVIIDAPFVALFTAYQRIFEVTLLQLVNTLLVFALAYSLRIVSYDKLIFYAIGMAGVQALIYAAQMIRCYFAFKAARVVGIRSLSKGNFKKLLSFSGWSLLDSIAYMVRGYGIQVIFNRQASLGLNAAYSISNQLAGQSLVLAGALTSAMAPGVISQYGSGDTQGACEWGLRTCKMASILAMLVVVPLFFECEYVLDLWLIEYPSYTVEFVRVMAVMYLMTQLVTGLNTLIMAKGTIKRYQIATALSYFAGLTTAGGVVLFGLPAQWAMLGILVSAILYVIVTVAECAWLQLVSIKGWIREELLPCSIVLVLVVPILMILEGCVAKSFLRLAIVISGSVSLLGVLSWVIIFSHRERSWLLSRIRSKFH